MAEEQEPKPENKNEMALGGNINLVGFRDIEYSELIVVKKLAGSYARKMSDHSKNFENLTIILKEIHKIEDSSKHEIHVKAMDNGKMFTSEVVDKNMFVALDSALKKVLGELTHHNK